MRLVLLYLFQENGGGQDSPRAFARTQVMPMASSSAHIPGGRPRAARGQLHPRPAQSPQGWRYQPPASLLPAPEDRVSSFCFQMLDCLHQKDNRSIQKGTLAWSRDDGKWAEALQPLRETTVRWHKANTPHSSPSLNLSTTHS